MKPELTYDEDVDATYLRFSKKKVEKTVTLREEPMIHADLDAEGKLIGIEIIGGGD